MKNEISKKSIVKKLFNWHVLLVFIFSLNSSFASSLTVNFDLANHDSENIQILLRTINSKKKIKKITFEFTDTKDKSRFLFNTSGNNKEKEIYQRNYPNGDFYYLIGDLSDNSTKFDYEEFYSIAKWLSRNGFRTIINVVSFVTDLEEALSNSKTSVIIWNSHGSEDGTIYDSNELPIRSDLFTKSLSKKLRLVLFANCWGTKSIVKYGIKSMDNVLAIGWNEETTSSDFFAFIRSDQFEEYLSAALGKKLSLKPTKLIRL